MGLFGLFGPKKRDVSRVEAEEMDALIKQNEASLVEKHNKISIYSHDKIKIKYDSDNVIITADKFIFRFPNKKVDKILITRDCIGYYAEANKQAAKKSTTNMMSVNEFNEFCRQNNLSCGTIGYYKIATYPMGASGMSISVSDSSVTINNKRFSRKDLAGVVAFLIKNGEIILVSNEVQSNVGQGSHSISGPAKKKSAPRGCITLEEFEAYLKEHNIGCARIGNYRIASFPSGGGLNFSMTNNGITICGHRYTYDQLEGVVGFLIEYDKVIKVVE